MTDRVLETFGLPAGRECRTLARRALAAALAGLLLASLILAASPPLAAATKTPKHDIPIPAIDTVVENLSIMVELPSPWTATPYQVVYQLQGGVPGTGGAATTWTNLFGTGPQGTAAIDLAPGVPARLDVVVPKFSGNTAMTEYRLLFGVNYGTDLATYQNLGTVALTSTAQGDSYDNSGSMPGNSFLLQWAADNQILPLSPQPGGGDALKIPANPPKLGTTDGKPVFEVWDAATSAYRPFFARGMAYEVTPVGQPWGGGTPDLATGETLYLADFNTSGGGQICQPLPAGPYGTANQSYCFDTDLTGKMHSYLNNHALKGAAAPNALLDALWERDLKLMAAMGVNVVRVYHIDALVRNMTGFLDAARANGIYVIMPAPAPDSEQTFAGSALTGLLPDWSQMQGATSGMPWSALMQLALARYAAHPAILAWAVGNETEADNGNTAAAKVEWLLAKTIKDFAAESGGDVLVTATNQDHYNAASNFEAYYDVFRKYKGKDSPDTYLDFYAINSYRGMNGTALQLSGMQSLFDILDGLTAPYDLPLLISEWGKYDTYDWGAFDNQWGIARLWRMILTSPSNLLGLSYFEYADEPVAKNLASQHYMGVVALALPADDTPGSSMVNDIAVPKFKAYAGITRQSGGVTYQDYPAVAQAGVFDSFIGANGNPLTSDPSIGAVPNIAYCSFSTSPAPWSIASACLTLDVTPQATTPYSITLAAGGGDSLSGVTFNGQPYTSGTTLTESGVLSLTASGGGSSATLSAGFDKLKDVPASDNNTLLYQGFGGPPTFTWRDGVLTVALPPAGS